jgi:hypothetical protein
MPWNCWINIGSLCWKPRKEKFRVRYCKHGVAHKERPQGKMGWDKAVVEIKRIEQQQS